MGGMGGTLICSSLILSPFFIFPSMVTYIALWIIIDISVSQIWGVSAWAAMFPSWRHQTGSELVVLHGCCLAAVLWAHGPKQLLLSTSSSSCSPRTMDGWVTGHRRGARPTPRRRFLPPFRPPLRFLGDWTAPARASGVKPSSRVCCCLLVHRNVFRHRNISNC